MKGTTTIITASFLFGAVMAASTAKADMNWGPVKEGGQCWTFATNSLHSEYGYWSPCPAPAAATATARHARQHSR